MLNSMYAEMNAYDDGFPVRVYVADITGADPGRWYDEMPPDRREKTDRLKREEDRKRSIMAYALLGYALSDLARERPALSGLFSKDGLPPTLVDKNGKPYFQGYPVFFNMSHSKDRVMVALSPREVGCDVEHKTANALAVARRFFDEKEYNAVAAATADESDRLFQRLWTLKESVLKCCGEGLRRPLGDFSLIGRDGKIKESIALDGKEVYHLMSYEVHDGYAYSVCSTYDKIEEDIRFISEL